MSPSTSPCAATSTRREASTFPFRRPAMTTSSSAERFPTKRAPTPMTVRLSALACSTGAGILVDSAFPNIGESRRSVVGSRWSQVELCPSHLSTADYRLFLHSSRIDLHRLLQHPHDRTKILFAQPNDD